MLTNSFAASRANNIVIAPVFQGNTLEFEKGAGLGRRAWPVRSHTCKSLQITCGIYTGKSRNQFSTCHYPISGAGKNAGQAKGQPDRGQPQKPQRDNRRSSSGGSRNRSWCWCWPCDSPCKVLCSARPTIAGAAQRSTLPGDVENSNLCQSRSPEHSKFPLPRCELLFYPSGALFCTGRNTLEI